MAVKIALRSTVKDTVGPWPQLLCIETQALGVLGTTLRCVGLCQRGMSVIELLRQAHCWGSGDSLRDRPSLMGDLAQRFSDSFVKIILELHDRQDFQFFQLGNPRPSLRK